MQSYEVEHSYNHNYVFGLQGEYLKLAPNSCCPTCGKSAKGCSYQGHSVPVSSIFILFYLFRLVTAYRVFVVTVDICDKVITKIRILTYSFTHHYVYKVWKKQKICCLEHFQIKCRS